MKKEPFPTKSFSDLVSEKNRDALKEYVNQELMKVEKRMLSKSIESAYSLQIPLLLRIATLENLIKEKLNETDESLLLRQAALEDSMTGLHESSEVAAEGDTVRYNLSIEVDGKVSGGIQTARNIMREGTSSMDKEALKHLLGMKAGEVKDFTLVTASPENGEQKTLNCKARIIRISKPGVKNAEPKSA